MNSFCTNCFLVIFCDVLPPQPIPIPGVSQSSLLGKKYRDLFFMIFMKNWKMELKWLCRVAFVALFFYLAPSIFYIFCGFDYYWSCTFSVTIYIVGCFDSFRTCTSYILGLSVLIAPTRGPFNYTIWNFVYDAYCFPPHASQGTAHRCSL